MNTNFIDSALEELEELLGPLLLAPTSQSDRHRLLRVIGFRPEASEVAAVEQVLLVLPATVAAVRQAVQQPAASLSDLRTQLTQFKQLFAAIDQLVAALPSSPAFASLDVVKDLLTTLVCRYLNFRHPVLYAALELLGLVEDAAQQPLSGVVLDGAGAVVRYPYRPYKLHLQKIGSLLSNPAAYLKDEYFPNELVLRTDANQAADKLFPRLAELFRRLGMQATYGFRSYDGLLSYGSVSDELMQHMLTVELGGSHAGAARFGFTLALSSAADGDLGLVVAPYGTLNYTGKFEHWLVKLLLTGNVPGFAIGPQGLKLGGGATALGASVSLTRRPDATGAAFLLGAPGGTHLRIGEVAVEGELRLVGSEVDYGLLARVSKAKFVLKPEGGGFLKAIMPADGATGTFDLGLGWSKAKGLYLLGSASLKAHYTFTTGAASRLLNLRGLDVELVADAASGLVVRATASGSVALGPIQAELTEVGAMATLSFPDTGGNLGVANADVQFKLPSGVGIKVESDLVTGAGYLLFDPDHHKYGGLAQLKLKLGREIDLSAIGILQTQLPTNPDAYSLVLLIAATFTPIQLGMGFTLAGLGGLVGINRQADLDHLRSVVRNGQLDTLLFPADVMRDPAGALATVEAAYPAAEGRYLIGLMARIGWGAPTTLLTLDLALILELPDPVRIIMLGVLQASLPSKTNELLKLRADFLGYVDFGAKTASFDASLTQSKLLWFTLTGDLAFRFYQGNNPLFVITAGGFHPAFQPPAGAGLTGLQRLTLALSAGDRLRLTLASYFAVTANTVQFGSHLDLTLRLCLGLRARGHFGLDALFQFSPFRLQAHVEAGVAIFYDDSELLSVHLALDVTGPGPWHVWGEASFRVWGVGVSVDVNATIGETPADPQLPAPDVHALLKPALESAGGWQVEAPATAGAPGNIVLRPAAVAAGQFFLDPRAQVVLRQRVAPLGLQLDKYGTAPTAPINGRRFELRDLTLGGQGGPAVPAADVEVVRDFFAPDQFRTLTDAQRLSLPSFQLLPSGLRLKRLTTLRGATAATRRVVRYEYKQLGRSPQRMAQAMDAPQYQQLLKGGALGQAVAAEQPAARAARPVGWAEDSYAVVRAADLRYYTDEADPAYNFSHDFASQAEAEQARQALVLARPGLAAEVLVVPAYDRAAA